MKKDLSLKKLKTLFLFAKIPLIAFSILFCSIIIFIGGLFACLSYKNISITSPATIKTFEKCINFVSKDYKVYFSTLTIEKDKNRFLTLNFSIKDLDIKYKANNNNQFDISKIPIFNVSIPIKNVFSGVFIPSIDLISGASLNIPVNSLKKTENSKSDKDKSNDKEKKQYVSNLHTNVEKISKLITSIINNSNFSLKKGVSINDVKIDFIDIKNMKKISRVELKYSKIRIVKRKNIKNGQQNQLIKMLSDNENIKKRSKFFNVFNKKQNKINNILLHEAELLYDGKKITFSGICNYNENNNVDGCVININDFPVKLIKKINNTDNKINIDAKMYGNLFVYFYKNGGLRKIKVDTNLVQKKIYLKGKKSQQIKNIKLNVLAINNFKKIEDIGLSFINDKKEIITSIKGDNILLKNGKIIDGNVMFSVNNIHLSDFYEFIDIQFKISQNFKKIDGIIDGKMFFKFNKKGDLLPIGNDSSVICLKKLIINSKTFDYNLSKLTFTVELIDGNIFFKTTVNGNKNKYVSIQHNSKLNEIEIFIKDFFVDKEHFAKIKQLFFDVTQFNLMKNIEFSTISNGKINIPLDGDAFLNTKVNLQINILSTDFNDGIDDEIFLTIKKNSGTESGEVLMDFGKSIMYSSLYNFNKNPKDKSTIKIKFSIRKSDKPTTPIEIDADGQWLFNGKKVCNFYMHFDGEIDVGIISEKANFIIKQNGIDYSATVYGDYVHLDYEFWHTMVMLMTMLKTPGVLTIRLDVKDGRIQDVKLDDVDFLIKLQQPYFWGHFDFKMGYKGEKYNMHFVSDGNDNKYNIDIENILPMLTLGDVDITKIPAKTVKITGSGDNFYKNRTLDGKLRIDLTYGGISVFDFTRVYYIDIERILFTKTRAHIENAFISGKLFDAMVNFDTTYTNETSLDANVFVYTPFRTIKHWFVKKPSLKDNRGAKVIKYGKTMPEFVKNMTINGKDFSLDENGKMNKSITDIIGAIITEQKDSVKPQ